MRFECTTGSWFGKPDTRRRRSYIGGTLLLVALLFSSSVATAKGEPFEVRSATSRLNEGVYYVTARIEYRLSDEALEALESGVVLPIQLQVEVSRVRRLWVDQKVATLKQDYKLSFQPLSERYVIRNVNSGEQESFATLFSALNNLGRVVDLPLIDAALLDSGARHEVALRVVLDQNTLPGPLRVIAFWSDGFRLESDWNTWTLSD